MINYNIINEFIEKLKAGKTTASDINAIAEAYKNGELTNTVNLIEVENIKAIPSSIIEDLNCGDIVVKNENGNKHAYVVTYKEQHQGICLTYVDASMCETQSYDYVTDTWTYNSEDKFTFVSYTAGTGIDITDGVISAQQVGTAHSHTILIQDSDGYYLSMWVKLTNNSTAEITKAELKALYAGDSSHWHACCAQRGTGTTGFVTYNRFYVEASTGKLVFPYQATDSTTQFFKLDENKWSILRQDTDE